MSMSFLKKMRLFSLLLVNQSAMIHGMLGNIEVEKDVTHLRPSKATDYCSHKCKKRATDCCVYTTVGLVGVGVVSAIVCGALANSTCVTNNTDTAKTVQRQYATYSPTREDLVGKGSTRCYPHGSFEEMCVKDGGCWSGKELEGSHGCLGRGLEINPNNSSLGYSTDLFKCNDDSKRRLDEKSYFSGLLLQDVVKNSNLRGSLNSK